MTMHLTHPSLSTTGKFKGKRKYRNAAEAQRARELEASWAELEKKWGVDNKKTKVKSTEKLDYKLSVPSERDLKKIKSLGNGIGVAAKADPMMYSGDKMLGVTVLHKSCLQPVFDQQSAVDAAKMRR